MTSKSIDESLARFGFGGSYTGGDSDGLFLNEMFRNRLPRPFPDTRSIRWEGEEARVMESPYTQARRGKTEDYRCIELVRHFPSLTRGIMHLPLINTGFYLP